MRVGTFSLDSSYIVPVTSMAERDAVPLIYIHNFSEDSTAQDIMIHHSQSSRDDLLKR